MTSCERSVASMAADLMTSFWSSGSFFHTSALMISSATVGRLVHRRHIGVLPDRVKADLHVFGRADEFRAVDHAALAGRERYRRRAC